MPEESEFREHLERRFKKIQELQKVISSEKKAAGELFKDYLNSLSSFPQWLAIFSGVVGISDLFNEVFLKLAFVTFLISALLLLHAKQSTSKKMDLYISQLDLILEKTANLTHQMAKFSRKEISESQMMEKEEEFDGEYERMRKSIYIASTKNENKLVNWSYYLSLFGSGLLTLSLLLNCY